MRWARRAQLTLAGLILTGCASGAAREELRAAWNTYRAATVPHPSYGPEEQDAVHQLGATVTELVDEVTR